MQVCRDWSLTTRNDKRRGNDKQTKYRRSESDVTVAIVVAVLDDDGSGGVRRSTEMKGE